MFVLKKKKIIEIQALALMHFWSFESPENNEILSNYYRL